MSDTIVAGHICLDIIPRLPPQEAGFHFQPGGLEVVGPADVATGGAVPNTGTVLFRLGVSVSLLGKVGDDPFGRLVRDILMQVNPSLAASLLVTPGEHTSYTIILSPRDQDRMFLHFPGANDTFAGDDLPDTLLAGARLLHFGYPPIMRRMYADTGAELAQLFARAKALGLTTSLDMCYPDPHGPSGQADWRRILAATLPHVDVFLPSLPELMAMLAPRASRALPDDDPSAPDHLPAAEIARLAEPLIGMGAAIVGIKVGARGLYLRTAPAQRLQRAGPAIPPDLARWADRQLWSAAFGTSVVGTTGAGDAAIAGLLFGLLRGLSPEETISAACAVGAAAVESADATSGVRSWEEIQERMKRGWKRRVLQDGPVAPMWRPSEDDGVWLGPLDQRAERPVLP